MLSRKFENILKGWIKEIANEEIVPENTQALNFGIFESENGYTVYLTGSMEYDIEDDDWACNEDFVPNNRYLEFNEEEISNLDWEDFQNLMVESLKNIIDSKEISEYKILNIDNITTGFDDGELVKVK